MITIYEANQEKIDALADRGGLSIREMTKRFSDMNEMDAALGFSRGTVRHWINHTANFAKASEACAAAWVKANPLPEPVKATVGTMLLVVCDNATAERAKKMLSLIGCEVTEV
jgi:hypothetical protein